MIKKITFKQILKWSISPTLWISDCYKRSAKDSIKRGERVKKLNKTYLIIAIVLAVFIAILNRLPYNNVLNVVVHMYPFYLISRCNEIFMAFVKDAFDKLNPATREENGLKYHERIQLALRSYIELILNYAMIYYIFDTFIGKEIFNLPLETLLNSIYFSVITIVAIGYGEYYPTHNLSKILVMYEVISGTLLLVVSFTVYVNLDLKD
ncbi:MAG: potassium channel family protein [Cellulosilyticaceae bacterium]